MLSQSEPLMGPIQELNKLVSLLLALWTFLDLCCAHTVDFGIKESHQPPDGWKRTRRAPPGHRLHLKIGLKQDDFHSLERRLDEGKKRRMDMICETLTRPFGDCIWQ